LIVPVYRARLHPGLAPNQFFKENDAKAIPHPPHWPSLTLSAFCLFGYVTRCRSGCSLADEMNCCSATSFSSVSLEIVKCHIHTEMLNNILKSRAALPSHDAIHSLTLC
jgi:hypothetical protein